MGLVPEDRKALGVILEMPIVENITLSSIGTYRPPFMDRAKEARVATELSEKLEIKTPSLAQFVQFLSGGNQQKVALAKWLATSPKILILDEPTRGIDVGSKSEIYKLIRGLADDGMGVIMVSSEMEEIIGLADRVLVMHEGKCTGILDRQDISEENIMQLATGGNRP
jgi:ribose transport system ATP-binding protein